jgi:hypothetical protein
MRQNKNPRPKQSERKSEREYLITLRVILHAPEYQNIRSTLRRERGVSKNQLLEVKAAEATLCVRCVSAEAQTEVARESLLRPLTCELDAP